MGHSRPIELVLPTGALPLRPQSGRAGDKRHSGRIEIGDRSEIEAPQYICCAPAR